MIERQEVRDAVYLAYSDRKFLGMTDLTGGFDFLVYRVDLEDGESVVFHGQRNEISPYEGAIDYGAQLAGEQRFASACLTFPCLAFCASSRTSRRWGFHTDFSLTSPAVVCPNYFLKYPIDTHETVVNRELI
jgi:hypothetical protein